MIDAHHHLWDLNAVDYPWLMEKGKNRFFGDPTPIQRNYLIDEHIKLAAALGFRASVHIQVGAADGLEEAKWVNKIVSENQSWPMAQVAFCDLSGDQREIHLDELQKLSSVVGVRQIIGRSPAEDSSSKTNELLTSDKFMQGLQSISDRGLSFDLQIIPELSETCAAVFSQFPNLQVILCHAGSPYNRTEEGITSWSSDLNHLSKLSSVSCKLSGLGMFDHNWTQATVAPIVTTVMEQFGAARVMFGSNFPVDSLSSSFKALFERLTSIIDEKYFEDVFFKTAQRVYFPNFSSG
ncbi:MAG: amidohydrolase family protein [Paracoccaceae bacterium]